ncbi:uncharacterized protein LOC111683439 [Lucilia cuprina]|uniref:uncharacterized protein LOC111683439 n=1 Tax=Lucilia cuprina TaxID=7375 RepID=UPI001F062844|nr:uncharacterized protein LOC111683439 [Lucilia cuprina]
MGYKLYMLLHVVSITTPIWAAFKDFVIENESDLERFGLNNNDMMYDDVDLEYQMLNDDIYDDVDSSYGALASSCGDYGGMSNSYDIFRSYDEDVNDLSMPGYEHQIDKNLLREIIRQLANDPRFQHLKEHLTEDKLLLSYKDEERDYDENLPSPNYVDYYEDHYNLF